MASDAKTKSILKEFIEKHGVEFRGYKNTLIFLIADESEFEGLKSTVKRFLALNGIKTDKEVLKALTEMDRERLEQKLKEGEPSVSVRILSTYRHLAVGSKDGVRTFDMGIPTVGERLSLAARAKDFLKDQEVLLTKISPKVVMEKTFSGEDKQKGVIDIGEAFLKYPGLPILERDTVLKSAIAERVQKGTFGLMKEGKVTYQEVVPLEDIAEDTVIIRKEEAEKLKGGVEAPPVEVEVKEKPPIKEGIRKYILKFQVSPDKLSELIRGVFAPLTKDGAQISLKNVMARGHLI